MHLDFAVLIIRTEKITTKKTLVKSGWHFYVIEKIKIVGERTIAAHLE